MLALSPSLPMAELVMLRAEVLPHGGFWSKSDPQLLAGAAKVALCQLVGKEGGG